MSKRNIQDILHFRRDLPPFLVHLTRDRKNPAKENLISILDSKTLRQSREHISSMRFLKDQKVENSEELFAAICVTETPLEFIHCLIDIQGRQVNLEPYGVVFLKDKLKKKNFHPALYFNNSVEGHADPILKAIETLSQSAETKKFFPLITTFGHLVGPSKPSGGWHDFYWEREWRRPFCYGDFSFSFGEDVDNNDVFCGLCPEDDIIFFEERYPGLPFIDPMRPPSWYAKKLIDRRKDLNMRHAVV
ncbi:abortive infection system antitoxin AbiGi family protein [Leptospirillum ferriphilum]|uniref:abortive infection system antitoxin AbiGi family protein n=1 Tax=Leptospirillum ferriphilum TaxID=178606 RepID=UPI0006B1BF27|nr:abortive infection system antitoxin AbiGi family protein [Leptospirillum ferriphilum]